MVYQYCDIRFFEDLASGKVLIHRTGYPSFPVRLAQEIFGRCLHHLDDPEGVCLYDPCCGSGYLLTILGFLNLDKIKMIMASDISEEAVRLADENLSLLHKNGLERRIRQLDQLRLLHNKDSHSEALDSAANLRNLLANSTHEIEYRVYQADILSEAPFDGLHCRADILFTDVPYGNLTKWQNRNEDNINLLDQLLPVIRDGSIVAICSDKSQKFQSDHFKRLEKQVIGKRLFQIFRAV